MRFFHISDLHIGKQLHHYNLKEEQTAVLAEIAACAKAQHPDAIVIAGDIYDKSVPSAEAVTIFDEFLTELSRIEPVVHVLIISGNHDSAERLQYASAFLRRHHIHMACHVPEQEREQIYKVTLPDAYGEVDFYLLPFFKPSYVRRLWPEHPPETYSEAAKRLLLREHIDETKRNVLVSHQFYTGQDGIPELCDSETVSVGGIDNIDTAVLEGFSYVALGHLHGAQCVGREAIRYCGTPLKYSVSESEHQKTLTIVELKETGSSPEITEFPLHPLRQVRKKKGKLADILAQAKEEEKEDYVSITLTDEIDPYKPKEQLEKVFHRILEVRIDNTRVRQKLQEADKMETWKEPLEVFQTFYHELQGQELGAQELAIMQNIIDKVRGE